MIINVKGSQMLIFQIKIYATLSAIKNTVFDELKEVSVTGIQPEFVKKIFSSE